MPQNHLRFGNGFSVALRIGSSKVTGGICKLTAVRRPSKRAAQAGEKPGGQTKWITKDSTDAIASNRERSSMQSLAPERLAARLNAVLSERFIDRFPMTSSAKAMPRKSPPDTSRGIHHGGCKNGTMRWLPGRPHGLFIGVMTPKSTATRNGAERGGLHGPLRN